VALIRKVIAQIYAINLSDYTDYVGLYFHINKSELTCLLLTQADSHKPTGQHGLNHPAVFIEMPWLECECKAGREQGGTPSSIGASVCREGSEVYWNVPLSGLVAGIVYKVEIELFVMGHTTVSRQGNILYLSASTSSYTVRQPLFALRQKKHTLWDAYTRKTNPFQIEVRVCDMHPGLTSEEAIVGIRRLDSAANTVRVRCTDLESGEQKNMPDGGEEEWQYNFSAVVEDVGLSYSETVVALATLNRYGLDGWARSSLNTSDDDQPVSDLHIAAVVFNHKQDGRRASAEGMLRAVGFRDITFQPTYDIETLDLAALETSGRVSDNWDYHASEIGWNDVSNVSKNRYIAHALDFQDAIARHAAAADERGPAPWIAVFEDDIVLTTSPAQAHKRLVEAVRSMPRNADVLYVEWCGDDCESSLFHTKYPLISLAFKPHCSAGILFSAQGARKLERLLRPIDSTIDNMFANLCRGSVLTCYKLRLPIFTQDRKWGSALDFTKQKEVILMLQTMSLSLLILVLNLGHHTGSTLPRFQFGVVQRSHTF
jgi:hypothetical protein